MFKKNRMWILTILLVIIEQVIKLIINSKYLDAHEHIFANFIYFDPMFNRDYSWFNSMLQLGVSKWLHVVLVAIMTILIILSYEFLKRKKNAGKFEDITFSFLLAGAVCSLIDKIFWNGSLDYILVKGFFTFDLKDAYINIFIGLVILMFVVDYRGIRHGDDKEIFREFINFIKRK